MKISKRYKYIVKASGDFVLDYVESFKGIQPCWFIGRGRVAGNTSPIPSGLHSTPLQAWEAAAKALGLVVVLLLAAAQLVTAQSGKWLNTTEDTKASQFIFAGGGSGHLLLTEDYEVVKTHEVCASMTGYFLEKSNLGRYDVNFKGMRTSATFQFTTQYDAEKWAEKWCTPKSLTSITAGRGTFERKY